MAIAACFTLAMIHAQIAFRLSGRARAANGFFTLSALAVALTGGVELILLHTRDLETYRLLMRWAQAPICVMILSLAGFVHNFFGTGRRRLALAAGGLATLVLVANSLAPGPYNVRHAVGLETVESLGGVSFTLPRLQGGWLSLLETIPATVLIVFVADASLALRRQGQPLRAAVVGGSIVFSLLVSRGYALLVEEGVARTPFFFVFPYLALLLAMGRELSLDIHRASLLSEELRESEHRTDLAARAAALGFWLWDLSVDEIWATDSARVLFGVPRDEPLNFARFLEALDPADREPVQRAAMRAMQTGEDYEMEYRIRVVGGGERWIQARGRTDGAGSTRMRGVVQDVTERRLARHEADQMRRELAHISRVSTMGELAASIAHELSQPLAAILSNAQAARRFLASPSPDLDEIRAILDDIVKDDKLAAEVLHRLRAMVQKQAHGRPEPVELPELLHDAERLLHGELVDRNVDLSLRLAPGLPRVLAAPVPVQQVLLNLMMNALDSLVANPEGQRRLVVEALREGDKVRVSVADNGPGIPESVQADIFRPFFTTKTKGLGMGLSVSRSIVESFGGRLWADTPSSGGARFTFELPAL